MVHLSGRGISCLSQHRSGQNRAAALEYALMKVDFINTGPNKVGRKILAKHRASVNIHLSSNNARNSEIGTGAVNGLR